MWHCSLKPSGTAPGFPLPIAQGKILPGKSVFLFAGHSPEHSSASSQAGHVSFQRHSWQSSPPLFKAESSLQRALCILSPACSGSEQCLGSPAHNPRPNLPGRGEIGAVVVTSASACGCSWREKGAEGQAGAEMARTTQQQLKHRTDITRNHKAEQEQS